MTLALALPLRRRAPPQWPPPQTLTPTAAERIARGTLGEPQAWTDYERSARRVSRVALLAASIFGAGALAAQPALLGLAALAGLGAAFDEARRKLGATLHLREDCLVVERGPHAGLRLPRAAVVAVGFGAPARDALHRAPETFWRGDFGELARSHLLVVRLDGADGRPRRLIVPEASVGAAQAAGARLKAWLREPR